MGDYGVNVIIVYGVPISIFLPHHQLYFYSALDITKLYCSNIVKLKKKKNLELLFICNKTDGIC